MKDFRLSELKAHCDKMFELYGEQACERCGESEIGRVCLGHFKNGVSELPKVERRDMIDLPCKEHFIWMNHGELVAEDWRVYYRVHLYCLIETAIFPTEPEADAFLAKLERDKKFVLDI